MAKGPKKGRKVRVEFRQNRVVRRRGEDWTQKLRADEDRALDARSHESIRAKGELSRKRTILVDESEPSSPSASVDAAQWRSGVTVAVHGLVCRVCDEQNRIWDCTVRRILRTLLIEQRSPVTVGDRVWFSVSAEPGASGDIVPEAVSAWRRQFGTSTEVAPGVGVIERVEERRTRLSRKERRGREHTIVANADQLLIVASIVQPRLKPHLIDRYIIAAHKGGMRPLIALNKAELSETDWEAQVAAAQGAAEERIVAAAAELAAEADESDWDADAADFEQDAAGDEGELDGSAADAAEMLDDADDLEQGAADESPEAEIDLVGDAELVDLEDEGEGIPRQTVADVVAEYRRLGYRVIFTSALSGMGIEELRAEMAGHTTVLSGQSGVGKSSLINAIHPGLTLSTGDVSDENDKGKHTTSHAQLLPLTFGGFVVDTPGVRAFDLWGLEPADLEAYFVEIAPLVARCQYSNCTHIDQDGCAVVEAVENEQISLRRYASYVKMYAEAKRVKRW